MFNKALKKEKRNYDRKFVIELDAINTSNPRKFWETLKGLGPRRNNDVPSIVKLDNGEMTSGDSMVKEKWFSDYNKFYNYVEYDDDFDNFLEDIAEYSKTLENTMVYDGE